MESRRKERKWGPLPKDPYEALGIAPGATKEEIRIAHKRMSRKYHPDLNRDNQKEATEWIQIINEAKSVLLDPNFRATHFTEFRPTGRSYGGENTRQRQERESTERMRQEAERTRRAAQERAQRAQEAADSIHQAAEEARRQREADAERVRQAREEATRQQQAREEADGMTEEERIRQASRERVRQAQEDAARQRPPETPPPAVSERGFVKRNWKRALAAGLFAVASYLGVEKGGEKLGWWGDKDTTKVEEQKKNRGKRSKEGIPGDSPVIRIANFIGLKDIARPLSEVVKEIGLEKIVDGIIDSEGGSLKGVMNNPGNIKFTGASDQTDSKIPATDGGTFASYATSEAGRQAIRNIIESVASGNSGIYGPNPTFESFVNRYTNTTTKGIVASAPSRDEIRTGETEKPVEEREEVEVTQENMQRLTEEQAKEEKKTEVIPIPAPVTPRQEEVTPATAPPEPAPIIKPDMPKPFGPRNAFGGPMEVEIPKTPATAEEIRKGIIKKLEAPIQDETPTQAGTFTQDAKHGERFAELSREENILLQTNPKFVQNNPFHLTGRELIQVYEVHQKNIARINESSDPDDRLKKYLRELEDKTGERPRRGRGRYGLKDLETVEEYIARALQKAVKMGQLDTVIIK